VDGKNVVPEVHVVLDKMTAFANRVRSGAWQGHTGKRIKNVVNIGIGGSDLGPVMAYEALKHYAKRDLKFLFVSNVDGADFVEAVYDLDPEETLFIVSSKTFTTQETMTNAESARDWLLRGLGGNKKAVAKHFVAVSTNAEKVSAFGIDTANMFGFWDWVGGRYSVWSAIGLPLAISIGAFAFQDMLLGARAMDEHFMSAPPAQNLPLLMALLGIWNRNFLGATTHNVAPYASPLGKFAAFLQQMDMESNGKRIHIDGSPVEIATAPVVWGGLGIDGQHAYFQLIHQGRHLVPMDFIGLRTERSPLPFAAEHHRIVLLNMQAQAQALALGRTPEETVHELRASGMDEAEVQHLAPHRSYPGNVPSSTIWIDALTPRSLGALIALYEHKVFCQAAIWGIHAYDQWGVELGKKMAKDMEATQAEHLA
jgi:glucose-6-phosphate isomerase